MLPRDDKSYLNGCLYLLGIICCFIFLAGCQEPPRQLKPVVLVSLPPLANYLAEIFGSEYDFVSLLTANQGHEVFEPNLATVNNLAAAKVLVILGHENLAAEKKWLEYTQAQNPSIKVVNNIGEFASLNSEDAHLWLAPLNMLKLVRYSTAELIKIFPEKQSEIEKRLNTVVAGIKSLDLLTRERLKNLKLKSFIVFHPAWGYFAEQYGLKQIPIEEHGKEPSIKYLDKLIETSRAEGLRTVFIEPQIPVENARQIAQKLGTSAKVGSVQVIDPLAPDYAKNIELMTILLTQAAS
ncbi:zinc ABC transporter substrate-binding protein [bacterium]|nr:zinc ABC transporter substrate-binding protein [bacterium]